MQYILTKEELIDLVPKKELDRAKFLGRKAGEFILKKEGFVCIHDKEKPQFDDYCDDCPIWQCNSSELSNSLCDKRKSWSK